MTLPPRTLTTRERTGIDLLTVRGCTPVVVARVLAVPAADVYQHLAAADVWNRPARDVRPEPNNPPSSAHDRAQQQAAARAEALAYYGKPTTTSTAVHGPRPTATVAA